jgi:hypothetical protein
MTSYQPRKKFSHHCEKCDFNASSPAEWLIHIETKKHKRDGEPKSKICSICDIEFTSHWIQKMHVLKIHQTQEERAKHKYYCGICDYVFLSDLYLNKHLEGKIHKNLAKALESIKNKN